ncbi:MAG: Ig-like domain-containing protein [Oscillospiraceae bacterium]|nr:Ig-like domain-containing protein [Oscillospiraceae bacterium]
MLKKINFKGILSLLLSVCVLLGLCGMTVFSDNEDTAFAGNKNADNYEVTIPATKIRLKGKQTNKIIIGDTFQIEYSLYPKKSDDIISYKSFNKAVVKVDEDGLVKAIGYGETLVQLKTSTGIKENIYFVVTDIYGNEQVEAVKGDVDSIDFVDSSAMIRIGKTFQIEPVFYPLGIYNDVEYSSQDPNIARVSASGEVTGVNAGTTIITVTTVNDVYAEFEVTVYSDVFRGIDVSKWQGKINWKKVSKSGVDFAMIRSSFGNEDVDKCLAQNVAGCEKYGISYGFYHYTYAKSVSDAKKEARFFLKTIKKYSPDYPVVLDIEEEYFKKMSPKKVTDIIIAFMEEVEDAGYYTMIYSSANFFTKNTELERLRDYDIWVASWGDEAKLNSYYDAHYGMWQYSSTGKVNGIDGDVDLDYAFKDYSEVIRRKGLNNWD